jgi:hypothetical protein
MNQTVPYFHEQTKHRKIFSPSYWGQFKHRILEQDIIDNRNNFVIEFGIKAYYNMPSYMIRKHEKMLDRNTKYKIDHTEKYKTHDNKCVIVNSPYCVSEDDEKALLELGYVKYNPLYTITTPTYIYVTNIGRY